MKNDLHFHRVIVTHVNHELGSALVLFIDFGSEEWVPFNHLVELNSLFEIPPLAEKYFLADIKPKKGEFVIMIIINIKSLYDVIEP